MSLIRKFKVYAGEDQFTISCTHIIPEKGVLIFTNEDEQLKHGCSQVAVMPNTVMVVRID